MHIITIKYINQLAIKSNTINIQSYEYNYNKIHSESHKFNQILKQFHFNRTWSNIHINTFIMTNLS